MMFLRIILYFVDESFVAEIYDKIISCIDWGYLHISTVYIFNTS